MPKGYWIASLDVTDVDTYKLYVEANAEAFAKYEGRFLTRGGPFTQLEGKNRSRNCIVEFKDVETALACYRSPEYQKALALRRHVALADIIIMVGYDGPQPPEQPGEQAQVFHRPLTIASLPRAIGEPVGDGVSLTSVEHPRRGPLPDWAKRELTDRDYDKLDAECQS